MIIKESTYLKLNNKIPDNDILMITLIGSMINISLNSENCKYFFKLNFILFIFDIIDKTEEINREDTIHLLNNLCVYASTEEKEELLRKEIFSRLNPHLMRIINNLKKTIRSSNEIENFEEIKELRWLCSTVSNLLMNFLHGIELYISSKSFDYFLEIYDILKEFSFDKPITADIPNIVDSILGTFIRVTFCNGEFLSSNIDVLVKKGVILKVIDLLKLNSEIKKNNRQGLCSALLNYVITLFFNISIEGSLYSSVGCKNTRCLLFDTKTEEILCEIHKSLSSTKTDNINEKKMINFIPIILINIHKNERCPPNLLPYLSIVHSMITQPTPLPGVEIPRWCKLAWEGILNTETTL
jgi:hypothetical protein